MKNSAELLNKQILAQESLLVWLQSEMCARPAVGPENGGQGEEKKAIFIESLLKDWNFRVSRIDAPDSRVRSGLRPNIIAQRAGRRKQYLWLFGHLDVVPEGDRSLWNSNPWILARDGDLLYGRGVEDNQQAICSMLILAEALRDPAIDTEFGLGLVFMSDEENGSQYGLKHILKQAHQLFSPDDFYLVPDGGSPDGGLIEIAEKAQLWLKFTVLGKQCHASTPDCGINSFQAASRLVLALEALSKLFPQKNTLFKPPTSTFTPTRHEENVGAINILPGRDIFYLDSRILPETGIQDVKDACKQICSSIAKETGVRIEMETVHQQAASMTLPDAPVVRLLEKAIAEIYCIKARPVGIGGATVAAMLREQNLPAIVWSCLLNTCHQPNEHSSISATLKDAAVFAAMLMDDQAS